MASSIAPASSRSVWLWAALFAALATLAGSLGLSLLLGLKACPLCFYQRTFAMSVAAVLGMGLITGAGRNAGLGLLALPLAVAGIGVAGFHVYLEAKGALECPAGFFDLGTAPQQSLAMFVIVFVLLLGAVLTTEMPAKFPAMLVAVVLGGMLAVASTTANPPMPDAPQQPYTKAPDVCRPPYRSP